METIVASVAVASPVALLPGVVELQPDQLIVRRGQHVIACAPYAEVRARRTWLSLGSGLRLRVGGENVSIDMSSAVWRPHLLLLELLPPASLALGMRAARHASTGLLVALAARGADAR
jgi:hypothetical protein